jgi:hypothetical protein
MLQQEQAPEMVQDETTPATAEKPQQKSKIETLADMFREPAKEEATAGENQQLGETAEKQPKVAPKALKDLAEKLGVRPEDLYGIEVPYADGKTRTLGQLKDLASKEGDLTVRELAIEEARTKKEAELHRDRAELSELIAALPREALKPEVINAIRQKHEATLKRERAKTLEIIPEWKDEAKRTEELTGIVEHLQSYGFPAHYLQSVSDSRTLKYIRENYLREQRLRRALEKVEAAAPSATTKSKPTGSAPKKPSSRPSGNTPQDRLAAIFKE